ncbi:MAG: alpha/beta hydrolase [Deltaproteobacteria bacterium]|nr:alpha/beta hydrolase [Deltaproteobacteria bacterium]
MGTTTSILRRFIIGELSWKRVARSILLIILSVYLFSLGYTVLLADRLIFQPQTASYTDNNQILKLTTQQGTVISARYLHNPDATYTLLYSHGNAEDLGDIDEILEQFHEHGFSIIAYDYSGYGTSTGTPSEQHFYTDILAVYEYLRNERYLHAENIVVFGRSVGGGPSIDLASRNIVGGLIIQSSFVSAFRVITKIPVFPFDKFSNLRKMQAVSCPVLVIHGKRDEIIPFWHGKTLYENAHSPKMKLWVDKAHHNDVGWAAGNEYWSVLEQFVELLEDHKAKTVITKKKTKQS